MLGEVAYNHTASCFVYFYEERQTLGPEVGRVHLDRSTGLSDQS